jgi:hypothetical protein
MIGWVGFYPVDKLEQLSDNDDGSLARQHKDRAFLMAGQARMLAQAAARKFAAPDRKTAWSNNRRKQDHEEEICVETSAEKAC